jgi:hypothetical protein
MTFLLYSKPAEVILARRRPAHRGVDEDDGKINPVGGRA